MNQHSMHAQNLKPHQWQDRIIVILANEEDSELLNKQMKALKAEKLGIEDRKLVIYQAFPDHYIYTNFRRNEKRSESSSALYERFADEANFKLLLLGLDGTVKLSESKLVKTERIFDLIDSMPMRKAELKSRSEKD